MIDTNMEKVIALAKRRGFIYPGSDIYGGLANTYDYGPVGAELLRNIRNLWWDTFVHKRTDMVGIDASLISHQEIWKASGHVGGFADALVDCKNCKLRMRADHLIEDFYEKEKKKNEKKVVSGNLGSSTHVDVIGGKILISDNSSNIIKEKIEGASLDELENAIQNNKDIVCPNCGKHDWTKVRKFNLLFPVHLGIIEGDQSLAYLRGETAQGMFVNFRNVIDSTRVKLPFGIAQLGKSFRNEITPGNSVFRTLEFEQAEIEYFFDPENSDWETLFENWKTTIWEFVTKKLGIKEENLRWRTHTDQERSFYSKRTEDLEYKFPFGYKEVWGLAYRTDYDLKQHIKHSGKDLSITDPASGKKIVPHVIEPAVGVNRLFLMVLCDAYKQEEKRVILSIDPNLAPTKAAVFPLLANKPELLKKAGEVYAMLKKDINGVIAYDDRGNIGKRYLSQDEVGTPFCVTIDFDTLEDSMVTVRNRDTATQERITIDKLVEYIKEKIEI